MDMIIEAQKAFSCMYMDCPDISSRHLACSVGYKDRTLQLLMLRLTLTHLMDADRTQRLYGGRRFEIWELMPSKVTC
jgi:hypothetical protein